MSSTSWSHSPFHPTGGPSVVHSHKSSCLQQNQVIVQSMLDHCMDTLWLPVPGVVQLLVTIYGCVEEENHT